VPLTNYLGWFLTVYVFYQLSALYLRFRPARVQAPELTFKKSYYAQAIAQYAVVGLTFVVAYLVGGPNAAVTDAGNVTWQIRNIAEAAATVSIFTMLFAVALSAVKVLQGSTAAATAGVERVESETSETTRLRLATTPAQYSEMPTAV